MSDNSRIPTGFEGMVRKVPKFDEALYQVPVAAGQMMQFLAEALYQTLNVMSDKPLPFLEEDLRDAFEYFVAARCAYVSGTVRTDVHPKDIEYPSMLFPILCAIGRYTDPGRNLTIIPVPEVGYQGISRVDEEDPDTILFERNARIKEPDSLRRVLLGLRMFGVQTGRGLPMDKEAPNDDLFRLEEADDAIWGHKTEPTTQVLYARAMLKFNYLHVLYGQTRVSYLALKSLKSGLYDLVAREVRGPSRVYVT